MAVNVVRLIVRGAWGGPPPLLTELWRAGSENGHDGHNGHNGQLAHGCLRAMCF